MVKATAVYALKSGMSMTISAISVAAIADKGLFPEVPID